MTAAFEERSKQQKQAAILRTLADQVASPVAAGRKSRKALSAKQKGQWQKIVDVVVIHPMRVSTSRGTADWWKSDCQAVGIGTGLLGWFLWNWAFPLLLELAQRWIESQRSQQQD
jgi:hypothetical protein